MELEMISGYPHKDTASANLLLKAAPVSCPSLVSESMIKGAL